jgi:serine/threonine-protein kinase
MMSRWLKWPLRVAYGGLLALLFVVSAYFSFSQFVRRGVTRVPDLVGLAEEEAAALANDSGLEVRRTSGTGTGRYDDRVTAGRVLEQRPPAGSLVKRGARLELTVSLGPRLARVPDLSGQALAAAQVTLAAEGLGIGHAFHVASAAAATGVVGQSPPAGSTVSRERGVDLLVASDAVGRGRFVMPDLVNTRYEPVRRLLEARGLGFGSVVFEPYEGLPPGIVLRQEPPAGHPLSRRQPISLVVSGPGERGA